MELVNLPEGFARMAAMSENYRKAVRDARRLARTHSNGILSTLSADMDGWPFGSVAPYILDFEGNPILLLSDLAQHSRNIQRDGRVSLLAWEDEKSDIQQSGRATFMGRATMIEGDEALRDRYLRYLPQAQEYFVIHDFRFYQVFVERVRFIGGFGDIHWIRGEDYRLPRASFDADLVASESGAVIHMNADHRDALIRTCRVMGVEEPEPRLIGIDPEGFDVATRSGRLRIDFDAPVRDAKGLREAFVRMARTSGAGRDDLPSPVPG